MYILKNAIKNLKRMINRNLIIGLVIVIVTSLCFVSLSITKVVSEVEKDLTSNLKISVTIFKKENYNSSKNFIDSRKLDYEEVIMFSKVEHVSDTEISAEVFLDSYSIKGYNSLEAMADFVSGEKSLIEGSFFEIDCDVAECIIADNFANDNYILGDYLYLTNIDDSSMPFPLKIVGIYSEPENNNSYNKVLTSLSNLERFTFSVTNPTELDMSAIFLFNSFDDLENFKIYLASNGFDDEFYIIYSDILKYIDFTSAIRNTSNFSNTSFKLVLLIGGSILLLFSFFHVNERKYEVGVLIAMGIKKAKIVLLFTLEILMLTAVSVIIGIIIGAAVSIPASKAFIKPRIELSGIDFNETGKLKQGSEIISPEKGIVSKLLDNRTTFMESMGMIADLQLTITIIIIGIMLSLLSIIVALVTIMRFEPLRILSDRV